MHKWTSSGIERFYAGLLEQETDAINRAQALAVEDGPRIAAAVAALASPSSDLKSITANSATTASQQTVDPQGSLPPPEKFSADKKSGSASASTAPLLASPAIGSPLNTQADSKWSTEIARVTSQFSSILTRNTCSFVVSYFETKYSEFKAQNSNAAEALAAEFKTLVLNHVQQWLPATNMNPLSPAKFIEYARDFESVAKIQEVDKVAAIAELIQTLNAQVEQLQPAAAQMGASATAQK